MGEVAALPKFPLGRWPRAGGDYPDGPGVEVRNLTQLYQLVALSRSTVIVPESVGADLVRTAIRL